MAFGDGRCMIMNRDVLGYGNGVSSNGDLFFFRGHFRAQVFLFTNIESIEILDSKFSPLRTADTVHQSMIRRNQHLINFLVTLQHEPSQHLIPSAAPNRPQS